jgi:hypothetical protein
MCSICHTITWVFMLPTRSWDPGMVGLPLFYCWDRDDCEFEARCRKNDLEAKRKVAFVIKRLHS